MKKVIISLLAIATLVPATLFAASTIVRYTTVSGDTINGMEVVPGQHIKVYQTIVTPPPPPPPVVTPPSGNEVVAQIYNTYYGWPDNTPHNSSILSTGGQAGGDGTYANPITAASGYVGSTLDYPYGTIFYVPNDRKYYVIGDECGDNPNGTVPCHTDIDHPGVPQIDLWGGGIGAKYNTSAGKAAKACEDTHTRINTVIFNPASNYAVVPGTIYTTGCGAQYGDVAVTQ